MSLILVGNEKLVTIEVICYPMICSELNNQDIFCAVGNYVHLQGLSLVDNTRYENENIDLLIGIDYYYSCVNGAQIRGNLTNLLLLAQYFGGPFVAVTRILNLSLITCKYRNCSV